MAFRARVDDVPAFLARLRAFEEQRACRIQPMRADRVYGRDHLRLAAMLAERAFNGQRARAQDLATEALLYAAGERQVGKAIAFLGLAPEVEGIAALAWGEDPEAALLDFAAGEGWTRDDALLEGGPAVLDAFGVTPTEREMVPRAMWGDIILERVALVDVLKA